MAPRLAILAVLLLAVRLPAQAPDLLDANEKALKSAVARVAPSVVQIETTGGTEVLSSGPGGIVRKGTGPTTGLIVSPDGYIVSSAFNFANNPTAIFVTVPDHKERYVARKLATDQTRMVALLKIEAANLPVPTAAPKASIQVGQWAVALGRTLDAADKMPSISVGVVSALGRIWGKALQTDAKVSPTNYGGPLVDVSGRVMGVLVPASPRGEGEIAGVEWYDSGIGFAIPLDDILAVLPKLKEGKDLRRGLLGITPKSQDLYGEKPVIGSVLPDSAADKAGLKPGDVILEIDGKPVVSQSQVMHALGPKYEGDTVSVKAKRGEETLDLKNLTLTGALRSFEHPFLGVLPLRDDPEPGMEVRHVYPGSPADKAGVKAGDRIMKFGPAAVPQQPAFSGRDQLQAQINGLSVGAEVKFEVKRKDGGKVETLTAKLGKIPEEVLAKLPEPASAKKALQPRKPMAPIPGGPPVPKKDAEPKEQPAKKDPAKKAETGLIKRTNPAQGREYTLLVPDNYDPNIAHGLVIWLHPTGRAGRDDEQLEDLWEDVCEALNLIVLAPKSQVETGWQASELEAIVAAANEVLNEYTIDRQRIVAHGMGVGGQMAFYLGFNARDLIRGVATTGAVLAVQPKENLPTQRLAFFVVAGAKDPLAKDIAEAKPKLLEKQFPVIFRQVEEMGKEYLDAKTFGELLRWIDSLDRL